MLPIPIIGAAINTIGGLFANWQKKKLIKSEGKMYIEKAKVTGKIRQIEKALEADIEYDKIAAEGMSTSWKDELWTIWFILVLTGCFVPWTQEYVAQGFLFLKENCPEWFTWCVLGSVVASFGLKDWFKKLMGK